MSQFKELLVFGDSRFLDSVYAKKFVGPLDGLAARATADKNGKDITTYVASITNDGTSNDVTVTFGDGTSTTFTTKDTQVTVADNLTTDDATQALSAAQGVVIDGRLTAVETAVAWTSWDT